MNEFIDFFTIERIAWVVMIPIIIGVSVGFSTGIRRSSKHEKIEDKVAKLRRTAEGDSSLRYTDVNTELSRSDKKKLRLARQWFKTQKVDEAVEILLSLNHEREAVAHLLSIGDTTRAARILERIGAWKRAGQLYQSLGKMVQAAQCFQKAGESLDAGRIYLALARQDGQYLRIAADLLRGVEGGLEERLEVACLGLDFQAVAEILTQNQHADFSFQRFSNGMLLGQVLHLLDPDGRALFLSVLPDIPLYQNALAQVVEGGVIDDLLMQILQTVQRSTQAGAWFWQGLSDRSHSYIAQWLQNSSVPPGLKAFVTRHIRPVRPSSGLSSQGAA